MRAPADDDSAGPADAPEPAAATQASAGAVRASARGGEPVAALTTRRGAVLGALALAAAVLASASSVWVRSATSSAVDVLVPLAVSGRDAAPGVGAGALVVGAAALALVLAGRWGRRFAAAGVVAGGLLVTGAVVGVVAGAESAAARAAQQEVGVAGLTLPATVTLAPWITLVLAVLLVAHGLRTAAACASWPATGRRHDAPGTRWAASPTWGAGDDVGPGATPEARAPGPIHDIPRPGLTAPPGPDRRSSRGGGAVGSPTPVPGAGAVDDPEAWDALTDGRDPTDTP